MSTRESIVARVRKMLARANDERNDSSDERETALRMANKLIVLHDIEEHELEEKDGYSIKIDSHVVVQPDMQFWHILVYSCCCELNDCTPVTAPINPGSNQYILIYGEREKAEISEMMSRFCIDSIEREARQREDPFPIGDFRYSFGVGACVGLKDKVKTILAEREEGVYSDFLVDKEKALVLQSRSLQVKERVTRTIREELGVPEADSSAFMEENAPAVDPFAFLEGQHYGRAMPVSNAIQDETE